MRLGLLKGTLDVMVLKAVSWEPMHAFEIISWIDGRSGGRTVIDDAALLQALRRLEDRKLLAADWGMTDNGRRARYYRLTAAGRASLVEEAARVSDDVAGLLRVLNAKRA